MSAAARAAHTIRELGPVFLVTLAVVVVATLAGAAISRRSPIDAEQVSAPAIQATAGPLDASGQPTQIVAIPSWGVAATLPLATDLPLVSYVNHGDVSLGLATTDLAALGPACTAARDALGLLSRVSHGASPLPIPKGAISYVLTTIDGYDYRYQTAQTACTNTEAGHALVNRQTSILREALSSLAPLAR